MELMVERTIDLDASPDVVWRAITDAHELVTWFAPEAELDPVPGGRGRFVDDDGVARHALVDDVDPGCRLVLRWWPERDGPAATSVVTMVVAPRAGGTRLVVTERLAATTNPDLEAVVEAARTAWMWRLDMLLVRVAALARV